MIDKAGKAKVLALSRDLSEDLNVEASFSVQTQSEINTQVWMKAD